MPRTGELFLRGFRRVPCRVVRGPQVRGVDHLVFPWFVVEWVDRIFRLFDDGPDFTVGSLSVWIIWTVCAYARRSILRWGGIRAFLT